MGVLMNPLFVGPLLDFGKGILDRFFPDPEKKAQAEREFMLLLQEQDFRKVIAQLEVNAKEAASPHLWVAGWRPGAGWAGVAGLLYTTIGHPVLSWLSAIKGWPEPPQIDGELLWAVLTGMLGISVSRSYEKVKGVASK